MRDKTARAMVICILAFASGEYVARAQKSSARADSPSEHVRAILRFSSESADANESAVADLLKRKPELAKLTDRLKADPNDIEAIRALAEAYLHEGLYRNAYDLFQQLQLRSSGDFAASIGLASVWDACGESSLALEYATRATVLDPRSSQAQELLGRICLHTSDIDAALRAFLAALKLSPVNGEIEAVIGYAYILKSEWEKARWHLQRAVDVDGGVPETRNNLGIVLARLGDHEGALRQFLAVSDPAAAHNNLGVVCLGVQDWKKAQEEFLQALAINPEYDMASQNLKEAEAHLTSSQH